MHRDGDNDDTCCSARRTNRPQRERERSDFVAGPSAKCQRLSLKLPKKKAPLSESSNRFAVPINEQSREKRQRVIDVAIANAIAEQQVIVVGLSPSLIAYSIFILKIPYPRTQKAKGDDLLSRILLPEFHFQRRQNLHKTQHISSSTAQIQKKNKNGIL